MEKTNRVPKVKNSKYVIKVNGEIVDRHDRLAMARKALEKLSIPSGTKSVELIRETTTETTINTFKPKQVTVLEAGSLDEDM